MDYRLFHLINSFAGHVDGIDDTFELLAAYVPFALIAVLLLLWFWPGARAERADRQWSCIAATLSATLALLMNQAIGLLWQRPRPFVDHQAVLLARHSADGSFPSDHAAFAFAVGASIVLVQRRIGIVALLAAAAMSFARVYIGVHYVSDVAAGAAIGIAAALVVQQLRPMLKPLIDPALGLLRRGHLA
jgi:undecaprenyl-diphosphatase